jgi:anthraniloyl-CoA monooxygenase
MRVAVVGGGPAGLYAALLLRKADRNADVTVIERNPAGATYGWGVVFSDRTLTSFREADYPSYLSIMDALVMWDAIDVRYRDELVRCEGQAFAGISRKTLLGILQRRCDEVGVALEFKREATDVSELSGFDLVVGADGVRSLVRESKSGVFGPRLRFGRSRYIWLGTDLPLDSFTFVFRANDHGLFQVHAYPFDGETSTFIVECEEETWRRAGLEDATESESIAYAEKLFAPELRGHALMSNNSSWINFVTVKNRTWRDANVVLVGDAAHTAHFSIGSGTKLAMEDSIALSRAVEEQRGVDEALAHYEAERRPVIDRFQEAARQSQSYFENTRRYAHLDPEQFAFHLLTRSGRIDYDNLRLRDPNFVGEVDRGFARKAGGRAELVFTAPPAFTAFACKSIELANRVVLSFPPRYACRDGAIDDDYAGDVMAAADAGAGGMLTDIVAVSSAGRITPGCAGMYSDDHTAEWREVVAAAHERTDAKLIVQLGHAGRRGATKEPFKGLDRPLQTGAWELLAPSPLPYTNRSRKPREMTRADMNAVRDDFVAAARRAGHAGVDVLQLHMARGYLLAQFLSPLTNIRDDDYGGDLDGRMRFPLEVFDAVRSAWPHDRPLWVALAASDWAPGGLSLDDAVAVARGLGEHGCDLVQVLAGHTTSRSRPRLDPYFLTFYCDRIRNEAGVATMTAGHLATVDDANTLLAGGRADLCLLRPRRRA